LAKNQMIIDYKIKEERVKKFIKEFTEFALKGNVINLAVGIIIGASFQGLVKSLTDDIISPILGLLTSKNFDTLHAELFGVTIRYGAFITSVINFFIMALIIFILIKLINKAGEQISPPKEEPSPRKCPYCMQVIDAAATRCHHCTSELSGTTMECDAPKL